MLHLIDVELKDTRFYQEVFAEGEEIGRKEGRMEGRREGLREGETDMLVRILRRRWGGLSGEQETLIRALPDECLEALGEALLDFREPQDLTAWLARHTAS